MSLITRTLTNICSNLRVLSLTNSAGFKTLTHENTLPLAPGGLFNVPLRNIMRCHFPRPSERKRIKRHGYDKRMSTPGGQRILMRRILKGRHVYSH